LSGMIEKNWIDRYFGFADPMVKSTNFPTKKGSVITQTSFYNN